MLNYDESLPMSGTCVQSVKTLTKRVYTLIGVQLSDQPATGASNYATHQKHCLIITRELFAKYDQLSLLYISHELFLIP